MEVFLGIRAVFYKVKLCPVGTKWFYVILFTGSSFDSLDRDNIIDNSIFEKIIKLNIRVLLNLSWVYDLQRRSIALNPRVLLQKMTCLLTISAYGVRIEWTGEIITVGKNGAQGN